MYERYRTAVTAPFTAAATDLTLSRPSRNASSPAVAAKGAILPAASQAIHASEVERLARLPEAKATVGVLQVWCFDPGQFKVALGLDPDAKAVGPAKARAWIKSGRFLKPGDIGVAVLESHFARFYGLKVGKPVTVGGRGFTVVGIYEVREGAQLTAANLYLPLTDAQDLAGASRDTVNLVYLELMDARRWKQAISNISKHFPDLKATSADSALAVSDSLLALLNRLAWPAAILIIAMCLFFVYRSLVASTWERVAEFGTMKALGWRKRDIRRALMLELFCQVSLGAAIGLAMGAAGTFLAGLWQFKVPLPGGAPPLPGMAAASNTARLSAPFMPFLYLTVFAVALAMGLLVATIVARRMASIKPAEAWRRL